MNDPAHTYKVVEIFYSIQGEGRWAGTPSVFVRFSGCNLKCPFCDTDHSKFKEMAVSEIAHTVNAVVTDAGVSMHDAMEVPVVFTGGEPFLQLDPVLMRAMGTRRPLRVETNGTVKPNAGLGDWFEPRGLLGDHQHVQGKQGWVTLSPKRPSLLIQPMWVSEVKLLVGGGMQPPPNFVPYWNSLLPNVVPIYLQPISVYGDEASTKFNVERTVQIAKENPRCTLSLQLHKLIGVR